MAKKHINICTAVIYTNLNHPNSDSKKTWDDESNEDKINLIERILEELKQDTDLLILPAGFLDTRTNKPKTKYTIYGKMIANLINKHNSKLVICVGVDGRNSADQLAVAVDKKGIISAARKFYDEGGWVNLAKTAFEKEDGLERTFTINKKKAYVAVCWDAKGIYRNNIAKHECDFLINVIHGFGKTTSREDSQFVRKIMAGAAKYWRVHLYAASTFFDDRPHGNWPSGIKWTHGEKSVNDFTYKDISIKPESENSINTNLGKIYLSYYYE